MATQPETNRWDPIYELQTTDPVLGGRGGLSNRPLLELANRTVNLDARLDGIEAGTVVPPGTATEGWTKALIKHKPVRQPVRVATTANIALSALQTIDGVVLAEGNRVLVKNQTTPAQNGSYVASAGAWTRTHDFNEARDVFAGITFVVTEGSTQADTFWVITTNDPITLGTTPIVFQSLSALLSADLQPRNAELTALAGVTAAANHLPFFTSPTAATTTPFSAFARTLLDDIDALAARTTLGLGTAATHNIGTSGAVVPLLNGSNTFSADNHGVTPPQFDNDTSFATTAFVNRTGPQYPPGLGAIHITISRALAVAEAGRWVQIHPGVTATLPDSASLPLGATYQIISYRGDSTLAAAVGQNIVSNTHIIANSHLIRHGTTVQVTNNGGGLWFMTQFGGGHTQSLAANGWQRLPSGLIIQWTGVALTGVAANVFQTITLPISFPSTMYRAFASNISIGQADTFATNCIEDGLSGVRVSWSATSAGNVGARIIAIGR